MPNIRSQTVDSSGITITLSDGRALMVSSAILKARYDAETGSPANRKIAVRDWMKGQADAAAPEMFGERWEFELDFDQSTGEPINFEVRKVIDGA